MWTVYIMQCVNGAFYTGITEDVEKRFLRHKYGKGGYYTKYNKPSKIVYTESMENLLAAEQREEQIKRWSRAKKLALVESNIEKLVALSKSKD